MQSAQSLALRSGHQRLTPEHLLKVLLEDTEGLCANLIRAAGGDPKAALAAVDAELDRLPRVEGSGAGQVYMSPELARVFEQAEQLAQRAGDNYVTVERLLLALAAAAGTGAAKALAAARVDPQSLNRAIEEVRKGRKADTASAEEGYDALKEIHARPDRGGARRQARPGHRPRRGDPPHDPGPVAAHQEQPGTDRRARGRQDGDCRGPRPAHRQWRCAGEPKEQETAVARSRRLVGRRQIPRRV